MLLRSLTCFSAPIIFLLKPHYYINKQTTMLAIYYMRKINPFKWFTIFTINIDVYLKKFKLRKTIIFLEIKYL